MYLSVSTTFGSRSESVLFSSFHMGKTTVRSLLTNFKKASPGCLVDNYIAGQKIEWPSTDRVKEVVKRLPRGLVFNVTPRNASYTTLPGGRTLTLRWI